MDFLGFDKPPRPKKRHQPLDTTYIFQLRVDFVAAQPPLWRRFEIRSDASLWTLHRVLQGALDWYDGHLYRFALGHPFDWDSELFLCDYDVQEGEDEGTPVEEVRLDETLQAPGQRLDYLYDYGDSWLLKIVLEQSRLALPDDPIARCTGGKRAAPPEDSGGSTDPEDLLEFYDDPSFFDLDETNERIQTWLATAAGFSPAGSYKHLSAQERQEHELLLRFPQFGHIVSSCYQEATLRDIFGRLQQLQDTAAAMGTRTAPDDHAASLSAVQLVLDAVGDGLRLTSAGYLPPKLALSIGKELGLEDFWLSRGGESKMPPVAAFRETLQRVGLLRKYKGDLLLTKAGQLAANDPVRLWQHLTRRLLPTHPAVRDFAHEASLLTLLLAATDGPDFDLTTVARWMTAAGWRMGHQEIEDHQVVFQGAWQAMLLWHIAPPGNRSWFNTTISPVAAELARDALCAMPSATPVTTPS